LRLLHPAEAGFAIRMNIKEYISSGILEQYAMGSLSEKEMKEVEQAVASYPELKDELDAIQKSLIGYTSMYRKNPRPSLRQDIFDKIDEGNQDKVIPMPKAQKETGSMRYLMAAVIAFLVLNVIASAYMYFKWQGTEKQVASLVEENKKMRSEYDKVKQTLDKKSNDMHMVMNRSNKVIDMKGMEVSPASMATVYWNPDSKKVMLNVEKLPMPPEGMQYQLWALKDGKPIDAGVFDMTDDPMHMMDTPINDADAFAVTLEKMGGSSVPTLTNLYVMGKL